jgi:Xaa-Pro aminopeptidase
MTYLNKKFFTGNRRSLVERSGAKLIVVAGNGLLQRSGSVSYEFQQESNFFYLTGVNEPNMVLAINDRTGDEMLIRGPQTEVGEIFDGSKSSANLSARSGISRIESNDAGWEVLEKWIKEIKDVHIVEPPDKFIPSYSMYTNPLRASIKRHIKKAGGNVHDIFPTLMGMRVIKQEPELNALSSAIKITAEAFSIVESQIKNYDFEHEVEADVVATFMRNKRSSIGYGSIVASGRNACTIHYMEGTAKLDRNKPLVIDVGAQVEHYTADITRVFLPQDPRSKEVFHAVQDLQQEALNIIKPGVKFIDYERTMVNKYSESLTQLGLINQPLEKHIRKYMPHATSHFLGLDVHDVGDYRREFQPGMVITVEPGFYIDKESIAIRLEDDILITENGNKVLSKSIPLEMYLN